MKELNFKKVFFLFFIGSLLGWFLETGWTFFKYGHYIVKKGMIFGPFKPLYGVGIIVFYLVYKLLKNKNLFINFSIGCYVGAIYEYMASLFETYILHTNTWDYSNFKYNIHGRVYLPYIILWGILFLILLICFPFFDKIFDKIKKIKFGNILLYLIIVFMSFNIIITTLSFYRYSMRDKEAKTVIGVVIDNIFDDEYMKRNFPRLRIVK